MTNNASMLSLNWNHHNSNLKEGFTNAQQNGEFVDMTVAADGHLVKVHQLILGIASPYIKSLIQSATCKHPIIFLNNVSYNTLCSLLEYMYAGEVVIGEENLDQFLNAAKALRIKGLDVMDENLDITKEIDLDIVDQKAPIEVLDNEIISIPSQPLPTTSSSAEAAPRQGIKRKFVENPIKSPRPLLLKNNKILSNEILQNNTEDAPSTPEMNPLTKDDELKDNCLSDLGLTPVTSNCVNQQELQYTVSNRGSLQLILNRYIYNIFSKKNSGQNRRWRCVDYRDHKCPACATTSGNVVIRRTNMHNHPFHDKKIMLKLEKRAIYSAIKADDSKSS
ncbi:uncharacterized protein LOC143911196 isoform X2 [Arctopsyche grandis]|uniref:uncharacterized protein LOC143911196 isoform X2 n=1 Tax=Arctopsyche grandis TaxID=121162 RepID=UPI00406D76D2